MKLTGAEIFIECLKREGVKTLFALPGGVVLKIFDMLHQQKDIEVILTRHEQGAGHMAEGYAKATGKAGVCLVTSGPGMTNVITALADAYMDSVPLVCFSGQVPTSLIGNDAFQEADNVGLSRPCTKYNFLVKDVNESGLHDQRGVLYCHHRPSGAGVGGYSQRCLNGQDGIQLSQFRVDQGL